MQPTICDGDLIVVEPIAASAIKIGDIILYEGKENVVAHRVVDAKIGQRPKTSSSVCSPHYAFILRGDSSYIDDEPVHAEHILGKVISVERNGHRINLDGFKHKIHCLVRKWIWRIKMMP